MTLALATLMMFGTADAAPRQCATPDQLAHLSGFAAKLADAGTTEEAQDQALRKLGKSRRAVKRARALVPKDAGLASAEAKLDRLEAKVLAADSPGKVGAAVAELARPSDVRCSFTTGEIVAIAIGFILAILPGVLLLVLLC